MNLLQLITAVATASKTRSDFIAILRAQVPEGENEGLSGGCAGALLIVTLPFGAWIVANLLT